jgi:hypothetical protein
MCVYYSGVILEFKYTQMFTEEINLPKNKNSWRETQQLFFGKKHTVEFAQDVRIFDFFADSNNKVIYGYGDIEYFSKKILFSNNSQNYDRGLIIINQETEINSLKQQLKEIKKKLINADKIAIGVNKFLLYSEQENNKANENYDIALKDIIIKEFSEFSLQHYYDEHMKGDVFNFASPATQFFLTI